jgi:hypothetical protein
VTLTGCSDLSAAGWITGSDLSWWQLVTLGPSGFAAYARLRFLPDPTYEGQSENDVSIGDDAPLESAQLGTVLEVLRRHTRTPDDCYFCVWDGWGPGIDSVHIGDGTPLIYSDDVDAPPGFKPTPAQPGFAPASPSSGLDLLKVVVPNRAYFLFREPSISATCPTPAGRRSSGRNRAWCIAHDVARTGPGSALTPRPSTSSCPTNASTGARPTGSQPFYR